jgi:hypothetical protein
MRTAPAVVVVVLLVSACGEGGDGTSGDTPVAQPTGPVEILTSMYVAATPGAEPIATGAVLEGSTLDGSSFCTEGTIRDTHASDDPEVWLIDRIISCPDGEVTLRFVPDVPDGLTQSGSWTLHQGTGVFEGLAGSGELEVTYEADPDAPTQETWTGTFTR